MAENVEFLKDQVQRLSSILSQYQSKYQPLTPEDQKRSGLSSEGPHAPWLTNKQLLSPLLLEYDNNIRELNQQIASYQSELDTLASRVQVVTDENTRLHSELARSLEAQLHSGLGEGRNSTAAQALQEQMNIVSKERDSYVDLWRQVSKELDIVQKSDREKTDSLQKYKSELARTQQAALLAQKTIDELHSTCEKLDQEKKEWLTRAQDQHKELNSLQDELSQVRAEGKAATMKNTDLKRSLDEITLQLRRRETERKKVEDHEHSLDDRIHHLQIHITDLEAKLLVAQREAALVKSEKTELEEALTSSQSKLSVLEQREFEAISHVKESMQIAEEALMEKDQALVREQQAGKEIARLKKALATIVQEAGERTKKEVDSVRDECNASIDKMVEEIQKLEQESGQRLAQYERAVRDKKALEKELDKLMRQAPQQTTQQGEALHELQARVCASERARDESNLRLGNALTTVKSLEVQLAEEKRGKAELSDQHTASLKNHHDEIQKYQQQKLGAMGELKDVQQRLKQSEQYREAVELQLVKERAEMNKKHDQTVRELNNRIECSEEAHQRSVLELREVMAAQQSIGARWRDESKSLAHKFEENISSLKSDLKKHKQHGELLTVQLQQTKLENRELSNNLQTMADTNNSLQLQLSEAEAQLDTTNSKLTNLLSREKQLLQERRELHRQLYKVKLKVNRIGSVEGPPVMTALPQSLSAHQYSPAPAYNMTAPLESSQWRPAAPLESSQWDTALSELKHSIRQVRQDLGIESEQLEQHSLLSTSDLTHNNTSLVHS